MRKIHKEKKLNFWPITSIPVLTLLFSKWFRELFFENIFVSLAFFLTCLFLVIEFSKSEIGNIKVASILQFVWIRRLLIFSFSVLLLLQINSVNLKNTYSFTPSEIDQQIQRMNYYPPEMAHLGYILERKDEVQKVKVYIGNFISVLDFNSYFPDYFSFLGLPFFFLGIYCFCKDYTKITYTASVKPLVILITSSVLFQSLLGIKGKYGPFLVFPFIVLFIYLGVLKILGKLKII